VFNLGTVEGAPVTFVLEYWNGILEFWKPITTFTDNTLGFSSDNKAMYWVTTNGISGDYDFKNNLDWIAVALDEALGSRGVDSDPKYWIRIKIVSTPTTFTITQIYLDSEDFTPFRVTQDYTESGGQTGTRFVWVFPGKAFVRGRMFELDDVVKLFIAPSSGSGTRIDSIVINSLTGKLQVVTGDLVVSSTPISPVIDSFMYKLADILVPAGAGSIIDGNITDTRNIDGLMK